MLDRRQQNLSEAYRSGRERVAERRQRKQQYEAIAAQVEAASPKACDRLVAERLVAAVLSERKERQLSRQEYMQAFKVLTASPEAQRMKRREGKEAATDYLVAVLNKAIEHVKYAQRRSRQRDRGIER